MSVPDPEGYAKHVGEGVMVGEDRHNVPDHLIEKATRAYNLSEQPFAEDATYATLRGMASLSLWLDDYEKENPNG